MQNKATIMPETFKPKHRRDASRRFLRLLFVGCAICLAPLASRAQYHFFNVAGGSDCILQAYRSPDLPPGIYDAIHEENVTSADRGSGYFYGGFTHQNNVNGSMMALVQYVCWPAGGSYPVAYAQQIPVFAGTNMVGYPQIGEGSSCAIKGYWPEFTTNLWTQEAVRYWQPANGTPHLGYQGMWIKEPVSGNWYHVGTFQYPFAVTGVTGMSGWQENFSGYNGNFIADYANGYYHLNGAWQKASQIQFTGGGNTSFCTLINSNTAAQSACGPDYTNNVPLTLGLTGQAATPAFDPLLVSNVTASVFGSQLLVQWQIPLRSSPPLGYRVEVFTNATYAGTAAQSFFDNDPEMRHALLTLSNIATPYVRLTISDIFFQTSPPILITPTTAALSPSSNVAGTAGGLNYQYYTNSTDWTALPNFSSLTPVLSGALSFADVTPRQQRVNYGFNYTGFFNAPSNGLYSFTLHSGDGCVLAIDGTTVISFDGLHDSSQFMSGGIALAAGLHPFNLQFFKGAANPVNTTAYTDGLGLAYEGPGIALMDVPAAAFARVPANSEPAIVLNPAANHSMLLNSSPGFSATVTAKGATVNSVQFFLTDYYSYYFRPGSGVDYYLGAASATPFNFNSLVWTAPTNLIRARLIYNGTNTIDSAPVAIATTNSSFGAWLWTPLEMHNYPSGASLQNGTFTMLGDGMNLVSRQVTGDCTLIAHLAGITPNVAGPDGVFPGSSWRAGIILRGTTNTTIGQPLGNGTDTRFTALFSSVGGGTYYEDDTMRNGNGDANAWSGDLGGGNQWYRLQRVGNIFYSSISMDGVNWRRINSNTLANFGSTIYAGVFIHALQSMNPNLHQASLDSYSLNGAGVVGPYSVAISPQTNAVIGGLAATFNATVVGPVPSNYQWQLNGVNIADATNAIYSIPNVTTNNAGFYTVIANSVTSAPAVLMISAPAGSGVWTNLNGGSWGVSNNWSGDLAAGGTDSIANFSTLNLSLAPTVTLDGARTNGTLLFGDSNPLKNHNWTLSPGSGGTLTLATSSGTPSIAVNCATDTVSAVVAGTQGFNKTGVGDLAFSGASTITGMIAVNAGTLEMQNKSGDTPYSVAVGATLKIGYSTGGGYANTGLTITGNGVSDPSGFYLAGGITYNVSGTVTLDGAPTAIRGYGSGMASLGIFDINRTGLWCLSAASGSVIETNVQFVNDGYGMALQVDPGANNATGDLIMNGPLNINDNLFSGGLYKRGTGSLRLNAPAAPLNSGLRLLAGSVICGVSNCVGPNALLDIRSGARFDFNGTSQTVSNALLAGTLRMTLNQGGSPNSSQLILTSGALTNGGALDIVNESTDPLAAGDTFTLFSAPLLAGNFSTVNLPVPPVGLIWDTSSLATAGTLTLARVGSNVWSGGGADNNWSTQGNWNGAAPTNWCLLLFQGTARQTNTNDLLTAAGQIILSNGDFNLRGNSLSLEWGILNLAGNNTNAINITLAAPQSFVCSNGLLALTGNVTNNNCTLTLDGAGGISIASVITGPGNFVKTGSGTAAISAQQTFTGGTTINAGTVNLTGGGGSSGPLRGPVTVNPGGTLQISTGDGFGYNADSTVINPLNIVGGTVNVSSTANQTLGNATINLTGGAVTGATSGNLDFFQGGSSLNTFAASNTATISGLPLSPLRQGNTTFTVAAGTTPSGIDLDISSVLRTSPSGDAAGAMFYKAGPGTVRLNAANTFSKPVAVSAGTLLVNGSLTAGSPVTVSPGASLGGTGVLNGAVTNYGTLAPGNFGLGKLTISNTVNLAGTVFMELSQSAAGLTTNDLLSVSTPLTFAAALTVTNIGTNALAAGNRFKLFNAPDYASSFSNYTLPWLAAHLVWDTSQLTVNGTLAVAALSLITNQPQSLRVNAGRPAGFTVGATGTAPLAYQWRKNGASIPGAMANFYSIASASASDAANYVVIVTNNFGAVTSAVAVLVVNIPPVFTGISSQAGGGFNLGVTGAPGETCVLLGATNLAPPLTWLPLITNTAGTNGLFYFSDAQATNFPQRFYQLLAQ
jgi:autotransporter-associated beta strand protein